MNTLPLTAGQEWQRGWRLALACLVGFSFFSIMSASLGVFMEPLTREFGWSRTLASSGIAITSVFVAVLSPFFGLLIDKYGSRRLALPGLIISALAISSFSFANGSAVQWLILWGVYAVVSISVKTTVWMAAIVNAFTASQGLAVGVVLTGTALAQVVIPPLSTYLIEVYGWRSAYRILGLGWGALTFVLCFAYLRDFGRQKFTHDCTDKPATGSVAPELPGLSLAEARRDSALWRIGVVTVISMLFTLGLMIHQVPILLHAGVSKVNAAWLASIAGGAGIAGKLMSGYLLDRFRPSWVSALTLVFTAFAFLLLIDGIRTPTSIIVAMLINGYGAGSVLQFTSCLTARYAGMRNFGVIYGVVTSMVALGAGLGPLLAGYVFDQTGSYTPYLWAGILGCVGSGGLLMTLPARKTWA